MRTPMIDRPAAALLGLLLLAAGAAVLDWRFDLIGLWTRLDPDAVVTAAEADWFTWTAGAAAVVLGFGALWWLLARLPRRVEGRVPLGSNGADRIDMDVRSITPRLCEELERNAPVDHVNAKRMSTGAGQLVQVRAHVDPRADGESLVKAAGALDEALTTAFPDGEVTVRVLVDGPRRPGSRRTPRVH